ncbi:phospholipase/Carboxylesterase [Parvibaculum lavamentivorans DS-1]|uniref:Phospholipase/Carboxylesterase n=1 Tax=Parvibaculum lavamentivorans (strain DS-1 / DSM 13023 / NCIMB 13966) TaxID=402881 RepID=A7HTL8_PARL1|nr:prolyl oligopeptidase family serine peptidase [Parvibaculum lavamentivorans]ABS63251.1 phospholipase/Carboxylesterase [Parvibaculum lavamentivorans DS-1]
MLLTGPSVAAASGKARQLVVLCHGYGSDGNDLISLAPYWQRLLPDAAFIAPNAPAPCDGNPMGYQWFPISRLDPLEIERGVAAAAPLLGRFIDEQLALRGLDGRHLALVGFSQGTMMALHVGLRRRVAPACIVGYSGALAAPERLAGEVTCRPPVLMVHGDLDDMLPVSRMHQAVQALGEAGLAVQWHVSPGLGHSIDQTGLDLGGRFIADAFAGRLEGSAGAA